MLSGATGAAAAGLLRLPAVQPASAAAPSQRDWMQALDASLSGNQKSALYLPYEHPSRQLVNTSRILPRPHLGTVLDAGQQRLVWGAFHAMTSADGRDRFRQTLNVEGGGLTGCVLVVYGDPRGPHCQPVISGGHLAVRGNVDSSSAFGGPVAYGHQIGNREFKVPGNAWAFHSDRANDLFDTLTPAQQRAAIVAEPPPQLMMQVQGTDGVFEGLSLADLTAAQSTAARRLLDAVFSAWPEIERSRALDNIDHHGGIGALRIAYFANRGFFEDGSSLAERPLAAQDPASAAFEPPYFQIWRLEGPGSIVHFEGYPHVHAYVHVAAEPARQHVGERLATLAQPLRGAALTGWVADRIAAVTNADVGYLPEAVPGQLSPGPVTEGTLWTLDPFANRATVASIRGDALAPGVADTLMGRGIEVSPSRSYRVASMDYFIDYHPNRFGAIDRVERHSDTVRSLLCDAVRATGTLTG